MLEANFKYIIDTFFVLFAMVLIIFMVPDFAMLEAGLVRIIYDMYTPILIGLIVGALVVFAVPLFDKLELYDPVGALSVHLVNGIWGILAVGIFIINKISKFRAEDDAEEESMDVRECGVEAYPEFKIAI